MYKYLMIEANTIVYTLYEYTLLLEVVTKIGVGGLHPPLLTHVPHTREGGHAVSATGSIH